MHNSVSVFHESTSKGSRMFVRFASLVAICLAGNLSQAAMLFISPQYVQSFDASLAPLGALPNNGATTPAGGYMQFEFRISLEGALADEDFWTAAFNINLGPGLQNYSGWFDPGTAQANGYYPNGLALAQYDANGAAAGGITLHWDFGNSDFGIDSNDLKSIIVETSAGQALNRQYGEPTRPGAGAADDLGSPTLVGALLVQRVAMVATSVEVVPIAGSPWGTYVNNSAGNGIETSQPASSFHTQAVFVPAPEPSTIGLASLGGVIVIILGRFRRFRRV